VLAAGLIKTRRELDQSVEELSRIEIRVVEVFPGAGRASGCAGGSEATCGSSVFPEFVGFSGRGCQGFQKAADMWVLKTDGPSNSVMQYTLYAGG